MTRGVDSRAVEERMEMSSSDILQDPVQIKEVYLVLGGVWLNVWFRRSRLRK